MLLGLAFAASGCVLPPDRDTRWGEFAASDVDGRRAYAHERKVRGAVFGGIEIGVSLVGLVAGIAMIADGGRSESGSKMFWGVATCLGAGYLDVEAWSNIRASQAWGAEQHRLMGSGVDMAVIRERFSAERPERRVTTRGP